MAQEQESNKQPWRSKLWRWTGIGEKTLWEGLELLGTLAIPIVVAAVGAMFSAQQSRT